jgi:sortase A
MTVFALPRLRVPKARAAAKPLPLWTTAFIWMMGAISALAIWVVLFAFVFSGVQQQRTNTVLYSQLREQLSQETAPIGGVIKPGSPVALLRAPVVGLGNEVVVEGTTPSALASGPGHERDTPLPGQVGVSVLFGRSLTYGAPFAHITDLQPGTTFTVTTGQGVFTYVVDRVRHRGDPLPPPPASNDGRLILVTSSGSRFAPTDLVFVDSTLKGKPKAPPAAIPTGLLSSEQPMKGDTSTLLPLVLWLQALALVVIGALWVRSRWGLWQTWIVAVPLMVAVLWGASNDLMMLVPNLV